MSTPKVSRRTVLRSLGLAAGAAALPASVHARAAGANERVNVAVIGTQRKGSQHVDVFRGLAGVRVAALCDCDTQFTARNAAKFTEPNEKVRTEQDVRRLLDDKTLDAVVIATPNHWHALMTIWACQAGKDVYVEKPICHNIFEGRQMVRAAAKYKRIVQSGTQNRSDVGLRAARQYLAEGKLGKIKLARAFDYPWREPIGKTSGPQPVPATADYNLFQGPAPLVPLRRARLHYDWHFFWATGNGDCGNRGVHTLDHARWMIGAPDALPRRVLSIAARLGMDDDAETPNTQIAWFDCEPAGLLWEMKSLPRKKGLRQMDTFRGFRTSMIVECEGGYLTGGRGGAVAWDWNRKRIRQFKGDGGRTHQQNFIDAVRSRKAQTLTAGVRKGHISSSMCHQANISHFVGRHQTPDEIRRAVADQAVLAESVDRLLAHLKANEIDPVKTPLTAGPMLTMDPKTERFTGAGARWANM